MLFRTLPVVGLLLAGLVALASAHFDYQEFDSRDSLYDARDYVDVPFQPSLRAFLEEAVDAHKYARSLALDVDARAPADLEARVFGFGKKEPKSILVKHDKGGRNVYIDVGETDTGVEIRPKIAAAIKCTVQDIKRLYVGTNQKSTDVLADGATFWSFTGKGKEAVNTLWVYTK